MNAKPSSGNQFSDVLSGTTDTPRPGLATLGYEVLGARLNDLQQIACNVSVTAIAEYREHWQAVAEGRAEPLNPEAVARSYNVPLKIYAQFIVETCGATELFVDAMQDLQVQFAELKRLHAVPDSFFSFIDDDAQA